MEAFLIMGLITKIGLIQAMLMTRSSAISFSSNCKCSQILIKRPVEFYCQKRH